MTAPRDPILDHPTQIQDRLARLERGQTLIFEELQSHKSLIAGALGARAAFDAPTVGIEIGLDRIAARLELQEQ